ncbi:MAG: hypothetical protein LBI28_03895 [Treponema sp.]|nr:hypothetical protein [Treponema sp.]
MKIAQSASNIPLSIEEVKELIYKKDDYLKENSYLEITFLEKANFGIPGGDNWIVRLSDRMILIYAIDSNKIVKRYDFTSFNPERYSTFDIMRDIPGKHIESSSSSFGDFNGDGIDEIFVYGFYGRAFEIKIWGYDLANDDFLSHPYCSIPFWLIDSDNGPAPVEFMTYRGMYGFKVFFYQLDVAGGPGYVYEPNPRNGKWFFYTWDGEQREYVEVGEVIE